MPRIQIPEIPSNIVNQLTTLESCLEWMRRLEQAKERLEKELTEITMVLKYVVGPKYNALNKDLLLREQRGFSTHIVTLAEKEMLETGKLVEVDTEHLEPRQVTK